MKNKFGFILLATMAMFSIMSCGGGDQTPKDVADHYCGLLEDYYKADTEEAREAADEAIDAYEEEIEGKHGEDEAFMDDVQRHAEACGEEMEAKYDR